MDTIGKFIENLQQQFKLTLKKNDTEYFDLAIIEQMSKTLEMLLECTKRVEVVKYGLFHIPTNKLIGYHTDSNADGEFCVETQYILSKYEDNVWLVDDEVTASWVRTHSTKWYNADFETPSHDFDPNELKVVKVIQIMEIQDCDYKLPDDLELFRLKYEQREPNHYKYTIQHMKDNNSKLTIDRNCALELRREGKI